MSATIIEKACRIEDGKIVIVFEGKTPEEILDPGLKKQAVDYAATKGFQRVGINSMSGSFPVDSEGNTYEDWNEQSKQGKINAYRNEIVLMGGL